MTDATPAPPAGWLLDPADPGLLRWWDGAAWTDFRRLRDTPPPAPQVTSPVPAVASAPWPRTDTAWSPPTTTVTAAPVAVAPDESFAAQFDHQVLGLLAPLGDGARQGRVATYTAVRPQVLQTTTPGEQVVEAVPVTVHDEHRSRTRLGAARVDGDLVVTDRRLLLVVQDTHPEDALVEVDLGDVVGVTGLTDGGLVVGLAGDGPPLLLRAVDPTRREQLQHVVVGVLQQRHP
ncbi:DUF2510 domain-containing protein [Jatrophihabitans sp. YIM 134969]